MKLILKQTCGVIAGVLLLGSTQGYAQSVITVNPADSWLGYINWFNTAGAPGYGMAGAGAFQFGSPWGTSDLKATFAAGPATPLTLAANTIGDPDPFWYTPSGGPGAVGNKIGEANMYVETTGLFSGVTLTFSYDVLSNSLLGPTDAAGHGWTAVAFIKDFAPDYSSFNISTVSLGTLGVNSVSLATISDPARHVQWGFQTIGPDVWAGDPLSFNSIVIAPGPVPEPSTLALAAMGGMAMLTIFRRRSAK